MQLGIDERLLEVLITTRRITRVVPGAYRLAAIEPDRRDEAYALWLRLDPVTAAKLRTAPGCGILSHASAANWLDPLAFGGVELAVTIPPGEGDPPAVGHNAARIHIHRAELAESEWFIHDGVPVTSPARTVIDLMDDYDEDSTSVGRMLDGMVRAGVVDLSDLSSDLNAYAQREGYGDGGRLLKLLDNAAAPDGEHRLRP